MTVDVEFDMRSDTPVGKDPDTFSPKLREYHRTLWSKPLPSSDMFTLTASTSGPYLSHDSDLGRFLLSSDTIVSSHRKALHALYSQMPPEENAEFHRQGYRIAGMIVYPGTRIDGRPTINQQRGTHPRIKDRFDLTLECIRLHYDGGTSPLGETLNRYRDFFALFETFRGYARFFLLEDLLAPDDGVRFFRPFDGFDAPSLPTRFDDYCVYREAQLSFVAKRSQRIANWVNAQLA